MKQRNLSAIIDVKGLYEIDKNGYWSNEMRKKVKLVENKKQSLFRTVFGMMINPSGTLKNALLSTK
ncbi:MAG: hypothetical protein PHD60_04410 [Clostridia bacterium]|nr:hypothetical protein [Clostridia bacterium]